MGRLEYSEYIVVGSELRKVYDILLTIFAWVDGLVRCIANPYRTVPEAMLRISSAFDGSPKLPRWARAA